MQKITPNLWFNKNAKEAVDYYLSVFPGSKILNVAYYPKTTKEGLADFQVEFARQFHLQFIAKTKKKLIIIGRSFRRIRSQNSVVGVKTGLV